MKRRLSALICALCMLASCCLAEKAETGAEEKNVPLYIGSSDNKQDFTVYYINGGSIPYISAEDVGSLIETVYHLEPQASDFYGLEYQTDQDHAVYSRGGGPYVMDFDFTNDTITFNDYDAFYRSEGNIAGQNLRGRFLFGLFPHHGSRFTV